MPALFVEVNGQTYTIGPGADLTGANLTGVNLTDADLTDADLRGVSCHGATAYITHYPCLICTRILLAAGIAEIYYIHDYHNDPIVELLLQQKDVSVQQI